MCFPMFFLCVSYGFPMCFLCFSYVFPTYFRCPPCFVGKNRPLKKDLPACGLAIPPGESGAEGWWVFSPPSPLKNDGVSSSVGRKIVILSIKNGDVQ